RSSSSFPGRPTERVVRCVQEEVASFHGAKKARKVPFGVHCSDRWLEASMFAGLLDFHLAMVQ
ncbi:MAG: hypothetical protein WBP34_15305, partial [Thermoanaerobaculia bacterium]